MVRSLLTFLFLFITLWAFGQISQPIRFEAEIENINQSYTIVSAEENGLYIFKEQFDKGTKDKNSWEVIRLDTAFQEVITSELLIDNKYNFKGYSYNNGKFALLFQEGIDYAEGLEFIIFNTIDDSYRIYDYKNVVPITLTVFELKNDAVIFGGNVNYRAVTMMYNFALEKGIVLPGFYTDRSTLLQIVTDTGDEWFRVVTSERRFNRRYGITIRTYSTRGQLVSTQEFDGTEENSLTNGRIVNLKNGENILAGTYSLKQRTELSRGIYLSSIAGQEAPSIRYYNYANLSNFFNYMKEKRKERVISRIKRKKIKGKKLKFRYRLEVHDIIKQENQNILIGEAYYPTYTSNATSVIPYNEALANGVASQVFDGYKYTHAIIIGFDNNGNLLWDNSFEINDLKSFNLKKHVHVAFLEEKIVMLYLYDQQLKIKVIQENEIVEGKFTEILKLKYNDDKVQLSNDELAGLERWYGNVFLAFGTNKLKNLKDQDIDLNRKVFFINKIVVE
jgi:hypothetical protein